jgi:hypothetical protein
MSPRVFISHASEDKPRFVTRFAQRLRENGVDAWLDQWEMRPGDSFVDRIFEHGLKEAQAVVIVLSAVSVQKPWVREELNHSVVKRIGRGLRIIPVVIDACEVPECLQATLWQRIDNLEQYDDAFHRILDAIFDRSTKPPLGDAPERLQDAQVQLPSLTATDQRVLKEIYRLVIQDFAAYPEDLKQAPALSELGESDFLDSVEILEEQGYLQVEGHGGGIGYILLTTDGFKRTAEVFEPDYEKKIAQVGGLLVNEGMSRNSQIAQRLGLPQRLVNYMLDVLEQAGHIATSKYGSGEWDVSVISPMLKRSLE